MSVPSTPAETLEKLEENSREVVSLVSRILGIELATTRGTILRLRQERTFDFYLAPKFKQGLANCLESADMCRYKSPLADRPEKVLGDSKLFVGSLRATLQVKTFEESSKQKP